MAAASVLPKLVGQRVKRREDPRLIQGRGNNVALGPLPSGTGVGRKGAVDDTADIGTFGSRSQAVGGAALHDAGAKVKAKMAKFAAALLEAHESDLVFECGRQAPACRIVATAYRIDRRTEEQARP